VDVGSGHPVIGSNTYLFYRQGWSGLLIDPLEGNVRESRRRRPRDKVIRAAVGASDEPQTLYEFDPYELTTTSVERVRQLEGQGFRPIRETSTPQVRLRDLGLEARPRDPVVLSIDVEGVEVEVLTGNDWSRFRPRVICIEELRRPERELSSTATVLQSEGYILKATAVWTSVFVHADVL
jgi:FkbM family methyltransferase